MPVSGTRPREVSPTRPAPMPLAAPNSPARRGTATRNTALLEPYHDIASAFFQVGKGPDLDDIFLTASRDGDFERIFELLRRRNEAIINIDARDRVTGNTPLIWASKRGHGKIVQQLLKHGADVTLRNYEGQTAVEVASPAIRNQLLESVDKGGPHRNLLQAAWQGDAKLLKKILSEARVDINCRNGDGLTPLLLVTRDVQLFERLRSRGRGFEPQQVVSELLTSRADPNAIDEEGRTALHYVSSSKAFQGSDIIKMLLKDGSDVHTRDRRCFTPIHCASQTGNVDVVVALLNGGSEANARGYAGSTPLHISAINGHDHVVNKLLQHGADVTIVDDSGLTAVDVAKTKKVKQTLKQAWAEATQGKVKENLGPVRPPSSNSRRSFDGATAAPPPPKSPKKGGQVIFDTLPTTSTSSLDALTPRRAAVTLLQRQLNDAEKIRKAEDQRMRDVISATPMSRSRTPSATTPRGISGQRLSPLRNASPAKGSHREIKFCPGTKDHDGGYYGTANRRKSIGGTSTTPMLQRECSIPVTMLGFDLDDNVQDARSRRPGQPLTKKVNMYRSFSSDSSVDPSEEFYLRGQSSSRTSLSTNAEWEDATPDLSSQSRPGSVRTPSASSLHRLTTIEERSVASDTRPLILDLDQMRLLNAEQSPICGDSAINQHPTSQHLLPPTPIYMQNGDQGFDLRDVEYDDLSGSSKENSPRTEEEPEHALQAVDNKAYCGEVRLAVTNVNELTRQKTVLNQGQFNIETTRVQQSDDSGCPEEISSSNRSSVNSSDGTIPADIRHVSQPKTVKDSKLLSVGSPCTKSDTTVDPREKLRMAAKENAVKKQPVGQTVKLTVQGNSAKGNVTKGGVTVYSNALKGGMDSNVQSKPLQTQSNSSQPSSLAKEPTSGSTNSPPTASALAPEPFPLDEPTDASQPSSPNRGLLKIKLVPNKPTELHVPPDRPPPPGSAIKEGSTETNVLTKSSNTEQKSAPVSRTVTSQAVTKQAPPRPVAPPRSRTPSASSVSSSGSSGSSAPSRPPCPKQSSTAIKPAAVKSNIAKKDAASAKTAENTKLVTQTTSFRLSTYLQQKQAISSYNLAKVDADTGQIASPAPVQQQMVKSGPAIILTSQSQTQFDLSAIPDVLTTQPPNDEEAPAATQQIKQITVQEASPQEVAPSSPTKNDPLNKSLAASISEVKLNEKPTGDEHNGPVIWDPFETIRAQQKQLESENEERPKTGRILKSATKRKASERQQSAVQRTQPAKSKDGKLNDGKKGVRPRSPRSRPKSPRSRSKSPRSNNNNKKTKKKKGKKSDNKVEVLIPDHPDLNNVAFIGGVGWQLKTECNEDEPVHQVRFGRPPLDYDTDEEPMPSLTVVPNYVDDNHSPTDLMDDDSQYNQYLQLPGQYSFEDSDTGGSSEDDLSYLLPDAEETFNEVVFDLTPRRVNAVLMEVPKNKMLSPRNIPLKRGGTVDDDLEEIIPDECVSSPKRPSIEDKDENAEQSSQETGVEGEIYDDTPSMRAFDKKGVMNWKKKTPRSAEVVSARKNRSQSVSSAASTKSGLQNTPKQTAKMTPGVTPKQTPSATPSTTPKQTPGNTPKTTPTASPKKTATSATDTQHKSPPQPPPRKSKMNKNTTAPSTAPKPAPKPAAPKRNKKAQQSTGNKKEATKDAIQKQTATEATKKEPSERKADDLDTKPVEKQASVEVQLDSEQKQQQTSKPVSEQPVNHTEPKRNDDKVGDDKVFEHQELKKMFSKDEDPEIDAMIDEILKSTPHPSMSLSLKSQKYDGEKIQRTPAEILQMSIDARNRLETELNKSQNGKLFCQVPVQQMLRPEGISEMDTEEEPDVPISLKERKELEKLMNSLRKMELTISLKDSDENHNTKQDSSKKSLKHIKRDNNKPPLPPKPTNTTDSRSSSTEKSPRFVRKLDSWKDGRGKPVIPQPVQSGSDTDDDEDSLVDDDFHSDALSVASAFSERDDSIVPKDSRVVTSRIGRRSAAGHTSAMSNQESCSEDNVETIQWKRGNMLGKGAYGKVWCGLTNLGELIAVKQIELNINDMEQAELEYEKIQEEVELLKTLKHPNIVGYLGTSLEDNMVSIFMQFIPGGSIANLLARFGALEEEVFCHYTKQILEGVAYLHQNNVIHRDIKGGNVMLMHNGIINLIDFGCAKRLCLNINSLNNSNKGLLKSMRGTPYWMAPEVVRETGYGTKSDIWSIGCTVFEMATRKPPWADVPPMAAIFAIGTEKETPGLSDKFSAHAIDFVNQCMTRDQHLRPSATELLKHAFLTRRKKKR